MVPGHWEQGTAKALGQGCLEQGIKTNTDKKVLAGPKMSSVSSPGLFLPHRKQRLVSALEGKQEHADPQELNTQEENTQVLPEAFLAHPASTRT